MALTNLGFGTMFNMNQPFSPTLARSNLTPGMMQLSPQPTPMGGAAPSYPATANGIGGGAVTPGAAGAQSPGNILQRPPMAQPAMFAAQPMAGPPGGGNPYQSAMAANGLTSASPTAGMPLSMALRGAQPGLQLMASAHQQPANTQAAQQASAMQQAQAAQQLAQLLKQYNVGGLLGGSGGGQ